MKNITNPLATGVALLDAHAVQDVLKVDRPTIYRMAEDGRLPAIKVGRQWRFAAADIDHWLRRQETGRPARSAN